MCNREVGTRERSATPSTRRIPQKPPTPTGAALYTASSGSDQCIFCSQEHQSLSCHTMVGADVRRNVLIAQVGKIAGRVQSGVDLNTRKVRSGVEFEARRVVDGDTQRVEEFRLP